LPTDMLSFGTPTCSSKYWVSLITKHYVVIVLGQGGYKFNFEVPSRISKFISYIHTDLTSCHEKVQGPLIESFVCIQLVCMFLREIMQSSHLKSTC
jgi:hypothetical protein